METKIEHKDVRVIPNPEKAAQAPPDVKKEGRLIDRTMRMLDLAPALLGDRGEGGDAP